MLTFGRLSNNLPFKNKTKPTKTTTKRETKQKKPTHQTKCPQPSSIIHPFQKRFYLNKHECIVVAIWVVYLFVFTPPIAHTSDYSDYSISALDSRHYVLLQIMWKVMGKLEWIMTDHLTIQTSWNNNIENNSEYKLDFKTLCFNRGCW